MRSLFARLTAAAALLTCTAAFGQSPPAAQAADAPPDKLQYLEGGMLVMVSPVYPKAALARGETATVTVTGTVQTDGHLENVHLKAEPANEAFTTAVHEAVRLWRLQPRIVRPECGATETDTQVTVWFEIADGRPKVSYAVQPKPEPPGREPIHKDREPLRAVSPGFPARLAADPTIPKPVLQIAYVGVSESGDVINVTLAPVIHYRDFEPLLALALRLWKYPPQAKPWCAEVSFQMTVE